VVARECGFRSWARLKADIQRQNLANPLTLAALVNAANRALETEQPRPLYRDPFARPLAGEAGSSVLASLRQASWPGFTTGPDPYLTILTKFFDDALQHVVNESAIPQVVILGAELDTRAFRLEWPSTVVIYEVDRADVFDYKDRKLDGLGARASCRRRTVSADLRATWSRALLRSGFDATRKSAFLIEHPHYFEAEVVERLLGDIKSLSCPGSWIGVAALTEATLSSDFVTPFRRKLETLGLPAWRWGVNDPASWFGTHGWETTTVVAGEPPANYGRWPYHYAPDGAPTLPRALFTQGWMAKETTCHASR
jgi:methyltransferase (TIGR00027 family)